MTHNWQLKRCSSRWRDMESVPRARHKGNVRGKTENK